MTALDKDRLRERLEAHYRSPNARSLPALLGLLDDPSLVVPAEPPALPLSDRTHDGQPTYGPCKRSDVPEGWLWRRWALMPAASLAEWSTKSPRTDYESDRWQAVECMPPPEPEAPRTERVPWWEALHRRLATGERITGVRHFTGWLGVPQVRTAAADWLTVADDGQVTVLVEEPPTPPEPDKFDPDKVWGEGGWVRCEPCGAIHSTGFHRGRTAPEPESPAPDLVAVMVDRSVARTQVATALRPEQEDAP